jgi:hypothetical protein
VCKETILLTCQFPSAALIQRFEPSPVLEAMGVMCFRADTPADLERVRALWPSGN